MHARLDNPTSLAYLEMSTPTLEDVVLQQYSRGTRRFAIVPLFFASGLHLLVDLRFQIESLSRRFSDTDIELHEAVGKDRAFLDFLVMKLNIK